MERPNISSQFSNLTYVGKDTTVSDVIEYIDWLEEQIIQLKNGVNKMELYQIVCTGTTYLYGNRGAIHSKRVFSHYPTEEEKQEFRDNCIVPLSKFDLNYLESVHTTVLILELVD